MSATQVIIRCANVHKGEENSQFPYTVLISKGLSIQRLPAALSRDESLATEDVGALPLLGDTLW